MDRISAERELPMSERDHETNFQTRRHGLVRMTVKIEASSIFKETAQQELEGSLCSGLETEHDFLASADFVRRINDLCLEAGREAADRMTAKDDLVDK